MRHRTKSWICLCQALREHPSVRRSACASNWRERPHLGASLNRPLPFWFSGLLVAGTFLVLLWLERRRPLRQPVEPKAQRTARNLAVAAVTALALQFTERPMSTRLCPLVQERGWGVVNLLLLPAWAEATLAVVLLDYSLYAWH